MTDPGTGIVAGATTAAWIAHLVTLGTSVERPAPDPATLADAWPALVAAVRGGRITGALHEVALHAGPALDEARRDEARDLHRGAQVVALRLERSLLAAHEVLAAEGIDHLVLKGTAVAHLDHADPSDRDFGDTDLLVPGPRITAAATALTARGSRRLLPSAHPHLDEVFGKSITLRDADDLELDLHRTLTPGSFGLTLPLDRLWAGTERFVVGGVALAALDRPRRLLNTAVHLRLGSSAPHLSTHRDLLVQMDRGPLDETVALAAELRLDAVLQAAVAQVAAAGWPAPAPYRAWAAAHAPAPADAQRLRAHLAAGDDFGVRTRSLLGDLPWRERALVVRALVLPRPEHLEARGLTRGEHLRRLWKRRGRPG